MSDRDTLTMIRECHERQWATEYGRAFIPDPTTEELASVRPKGLDFLPITPCFTTWCDRCQVDHGPASVLIVP